MRIPRKTRFSSVTSLDLRIVLRRRKTRLPDDVPPKSWRADVADHVQPMYHQVSVLSLTACGISGWRPPEEADKGKPNGVPRDIFRLHAYYATVQTLTGL
jgi:hypothetical protein